VIVATAENLPLTADALILPSAKSGSATKPHGQLAARLRDALSVACDVRSPAGRKALVEGAISRFGQIDILVNNAGVAYAGPAEDESPEHMQDLIDHRRSGGSGLI
jgi:NAD(P)-dependent dehydrogenase (short-subunit alcohol dehydrogenase family)